jgi:hypothetical protein
MMDRALAASHRRSPHEGVTLDSSGVPDAEAHDVGDVFLRRILLHMAWTSEEHCTQAMALPR